MEIVDKCNDIKCPLKNNCFRFGEKRVNQFQATIFKYNNGCVHFWDEDHAPKKQLDFKQKERGMKIAIIGSGGIALAGAVELLKTRGIEIRTSMENAEIGLNPNEFPKPEIPSLELTCPIIEDYKVTDYLVETKNKYPPKKNWKQKLKKNRKK